MIGESKKTSKIKKKDLFLLIGMFLILIFSAIFLPKQIKAYTLNSEGNLVSDNLLYTPDTDLITNNYGVSAQVTNNVITITGTATGNGQGPIIYNNIGLTLEPGTYTMAMMDITNNNNMALLLYSGTGEWDSSHFNLTLPSGQNTTLTDTITITETTTINYVRMYTQSEKIYNISFKLMIVEGSTAPTEYEPYGTYYSQANYDNNSNFINSAIKNIKIYQNYSDTASATITDIAINENKLDLASMISGYSNITRIDITLNYNLPGSIPIYLLYSPSDTMVNDGLGWEWPDNLAYVTVLKYGSSNQMLNVNGACSYGQKSLMAFTSPNIDIFDNLTYYQTTNGTSYTTCDIESKNTTYYNTIRFTTMSVNDVTSYIDSDTISSFEFNLSSISSVSYQTGYNAGISASESVYVEVGRQQGYEEGYLAGVEATETDSNTLTGLVNAIMTSPVNMLSTIFNFEFLGVNLASMIFGLITLFIVIWLIRRFI